MALEPCPNCSRPISSTAPTCPKCGQVLSEDLWIAAREKRQKNLKAAGGCLGGGLLLVLSLIVVGLVFGRPPSAPPSTNTATYPHACGVKPCTNISRSASDKMLAAMKQVGADCMDVERVYLFEYSGAASRSYAVICDDGEGLQEHVVTHEPLTGYFFVSKGTGRWHDAISTSHGPIGSLEF